MKQQIHIMGIVNLNDDSFYAASRTAADQALGRIHQMQQEGAEVIDLGACSTRPGSAQPSVEEEWHRLEPVLKALAGTSVPGVSVDTFRAEIVRRTYDTIGPFIVNDISAGEMDAEMLPLVGRLGLPYVAMHMRGTPATMQQLTDYKDVTEEVLTYFKDFALKAEALGIRDWILDPGFGFAKTVEQNYELLSHMHRLSELGRPILVGVSRKSMIYKLLGITPEEALPATQVVHLAALQQGATWLRVHDVAEAARTVRLFEAM